MKQLNMVLDRLGKVLTQENTWLVTGVAGFIGSNLLEVLLRSNQKVVGLDNLSTGSLTNLEIVKNSVSNEIWKNFSFFEGDIKDIEICRSACKNTDYVLHHAALGSVPKSIDNPFRTHENNVDGFMNVLEASKESAVKRIVYASSSSVYGNVRELPQREELVGEVLSPYAASKRTNETYAQAYSHAYNMSIIGLRYFNVFGPRQNPKGAYAAVIPKWIGQIQNGEKCTINGDGSSSRDFTFVYNVVYANILTSLKGDLTSEIFNIALGQFTTLNELHHMIASEIMKYDPSMLVEKAYHGPERKGDIPRSFADISRAKKNLDYSPLVSFEDGLAETVNWFLDKARHDLKKR